jgi:hypothetical protein
MEDPLRLIIDALLGVFAVSSYFLGRRDGKLAGQRDRDKKLYQYFSNLLPKENMIYYREHDFGDSFTHQVFDLLRRFEEACQYPENYFLDNNLENLKKQLLISATTFLRRLREVTVHVSNPNTPANRLPRPEVLGDEEHIRLSTELNNLATEFYKAYTKFVIAAEKILA